MRVILASALLGTLLVGCGTGGGADAKLETVDVPRREGNLIQFSDTFASRINLKSAEVRAAGVVPSIAVVGTVTFDPEHVARVGTRLRGLVREVRRYEGDAVKQGELLASIDSPELGEAQAAVISLQAELDAAKRNAQRESKLAEGKLTTLKESEEASALADKYQALLSAARQKVSALAGSVDPKSRAIGVHAIASPLDGTIVERHIARGQLVEGDHIAFLVANLDTLWVELAVFERSLPMIRVGDEVILKPLGSQGDGLKGKVANVGQVLSSTTRSAPIRVEVDNRSRQLRPGQAVDAVIRAGGAAVDEGPVVPPDAVTFIDGKPTVFVLDAPNKVRVAPVELGASDGQDLHIKQGLKVGERVVTTGTFELKSELFR
ncbi:MAG TPA: efflux RND transporter periplasmic adaptor subunit [Polyangiaceae bacterium]|nr:efflux RND transporter periplasmic adaptor subunit [Polyangiaceae bacterium]